MSNDNSMKLATLWTTLGRIKDDLDNTVLPLCAHLDVARQDGELAEAAEELSAKIKEHFERFKLVAEPRST